MNPSEMQGHSRQSFLDPINYGLIRSFLLQEKNFHSITASQVACINKNSCFFVPRVTPRERGLPSALTYLLGSDKSLWFSSLVLCVQVKLKDQSLVPKISLR